MGEFETQRTAYLKDFGNNIKMQYQPGPWLNEPDYLWYQHESTGFYCTILRVPETGTLCGYIGLPKQHPWWGKHHDEIDVTIHGGLTYAKSNQTNISHIYGSYDPFIGVTMLAHDDIGLVVPDASLWVIGFDCTHLGDRMPCGTTTRDVKIYRDIDYLIKELDFLSLQAYNALVT